MRFRREGVEEEIAAAARAFLDGVWRIEQMRANGREFPSTLWQEIGNVGWLDLLVPEAAGGLGAGAVEAAAIFEEAGRALLPGPLFDNMVALPLVFAENGRAPANDPVLATSACFERADPPVDVGGGRASGHLVAESPDAADILIVRALDERRQPCIAIVDCADPAIEMRQLDSLDLAGRPFHLQLDGAAAKIVAEPPRSVRLTEELTEWGRVMAAARMLGVLDRLVELSVAFAQGRRQFGRPIAAFQAVQHRLADMAALAITCRSVCYASQWALAVDAPDRHLHTHTAKAYLSRAVRHVAEGALQTHGGIGVTEEYDLHLFVKHALRLEGSWGRSEEHEDALAEALFERVTAAADIAPLSEAQA